MKSQSKRTTLNNGYLVEGRRRNRKVTRVGVILFKGEPLVYTKLEMLVSAISPRYQPRSRLLFTEELHGSLRLSYLVGSTA